MEILKTYNVKSVNGNSNFSAIVRWMKSKEFLNGHAELVLEDESKNDKTCFIQHGGLNYNLNPIIAEKDMFICCHPELYQKHPFINKHPLKHKTGILYVEVFYSLLGWSNNYTKTAKLYIKQ